MNRVVITGIGAVTPLAASFRNTWPLIKEGRSGISQITRIGPAVLKWKSAGEVRDLKPDLHFSMKELNFIDPFTLYAVFAAKESLETAGLSSHDTNRLNSAGIIVGSSRGGIMTLEKEFMKLSSGSSGPRVRLSPYLMPASTISTAAAYVGCKIGIAGYSLGISTACTSGANAIGEAFRMIRNGHASIMLAGGAEAPLCRLCIEGYGAAGALSKSGPGEASRPFDTYRDGFVLAEGACMLVIEELGAAIKRNAPILGEIIGYGNFCDASHLTRPSVEGEMRAMRSALEDAGITSSDVDYINAHGTSTIAGDKVEADAIKAFFGKRRLPVSSVKSMTGHMLAASGALEAACTSMSIKENFITPTINTRNIDPECDINVITEATEAPLNIAITNSFGFGGANAVLVLKAFRY